MVLQNKYKAKASRRYQATKQTQPSQEGRDRPNRKLKRLSEPKDTRFIDHSSDSGSSEVGEGETEEEDDDDDDAAEFPKLQTSTSSRVDPFPSETRDSKYGRRKLTESKATRIDRLESEKDPYLQQQQQREEEEEEEESQVDISSLINRVAALDPNAISQAGRGVDLEGLFKAERQAAMGSDAERDTDHSLDWLHQRQLQRQVLKKGSSKKVVATTANTAVVEGDQPYQHLPDEEMQKEKEKTEAMRALKARFQGRGLGEREGKRGKVESIVIRPFSSSSPGTRKDQDPLHGNKPRKPRDGMLHLDSDGENQMEAKEGVDPIDDGYLQSLTELATLPQPSSLSAAAGDARSTSTLLSQSTTTNATLTQDADMPKKIKPDIATLESFLDDMLG